MKPAQPSRTAEYMAFFRACESVRPKGERLFFDPLATLFIRRSLRAAVWVSRIPMLGASVDWCADRRLPGARTSAIARTRLIDDATDQVLRDKFRQIVVLGAGFDCRAYRLPGHPLCDRFRSGSPDYARLETPLPAQGASRPPAARSLCPARFQSREAPTTVGRSRIRSLPPGDVPLGRRDQLSHLPGGGLGASICIRAARRAAGSFSLTYIRELWMGQFALRERRSSSRMSSNWENHGPLALTRRRFPDFSFSEACDWTATHPQRSTAPSFTEPMAGT